MGPSENAASSSGRSEMSSLTNAGMSAGIGNSMNISRNATVESMAVTVSLWVRLIARGLEMALALDSDIKIHSFLSFPLKEQVFQGA